MIAVSTAASYIGHGTFFLIALYKREPFIRFIHRFIKVDIIKLERLMAKYGIAALFISQWLYGFRLLSAAVLGLSRMGASKYFPYQFISCCIWAIICTSAGYFFGATIKKFVGDIKKYEPLIAVGVLCIGVLIWFIKRFLNDNKNSNQ